MVLLGDFNARVGKDSEIYDVTGTFSEETLNLLSLKILTCHNIQLGL